MFLGSTIEAEFLVASIFQFYACFGSLNRLEIYDDFFFGVPIIIDRMNTDQKSCRILQKGSQ